MLASMKFVPLLKAMPWGGRKLETFFQKRLPPELPFGESWEVVDLPNDQSVVAEGEGAGDSLFDIVKTHTTDLLGHIPLFQGRFPVLFKFIDAQENLSVQVHPNELAAKRLGHGARPKTEAWYILHAEPGARVYLGFRAGVGLKDFLKALEEKRVPEILHPVPVHTGEFIYLPAGLLHAIGGGVMVAEIQQASDTTYRVFDWNRLGLDGRPRSLHLDEALQSMHFHVHGRAGFATPVSGRPGVRCGHFSFERVAVAAGMSMTFESGHARILSCLDGSGVLMEGGRPSLHLGLGETGLLPACQTVTLKGEEGGMFLLVRV